MAAFVLSPATGHATQHAATATLSRDGANVALLGGCSDDTSGGLWLVVRVNPIVGPPVASAEVWFAGVNPDNGIGLQFIASVPAPSEGSAGCVARDNTRVMWQIAKRELQLYRLTKGGLPRVATLPGWEDPVAAGLVRGSLVFVAGSALGIINLESIEVKRHERLTLVAAIEQRNGDVYSVLAVDGVVDSHGFPPVTLVRETLEDNGALSSLAKTDSWPMMETIGKRSGVSLESEDFEAVNYSLATTSNAVVLLRNYFFGRSQLVLRSWNLETLELVEEFRVDVEDTVDDSGGLRAGAAGDEILAGVSKMTDGVEHVRVLHMRNGVVSRESVAPQSVPKTPVVILDIVPFNLKQWIYAVSTQQPSGASPAFVAINAFDIR